MNQVIQNIRDRAEAFENFMCERRKIILELQKIHNASKRNLPHKKRIILDQQQQQLLEQLNEMTNNTEKRLKEIRARRQN